MKTIKLIHIKFNLHPINANTLPSVEQFRSGIISYLGKNFINLHNHNENKFIYKYPGIQFKLYNNFYYILAINRSADDLLEQVEKKDFIFSTKYFEIKESPTYNLKLQKINIIDKPIQYKVSRWFSLNEKNFEIFNNEPSLINRISMLEKILSANILSFAKGIEWTIDKPINTSIISINKSEFAQFKNIRVQTFDVIFNTNVILPNLIGLGKSVSKGFGIVTKINSNRLKKQNNSNYE